MVSMERPQPARLLGPRRSYLKPQKGVSVCVLCCVLEDCWMQWAVFIQESFAASLSLLRTSSPQKPCPVFASLRLAMSVAGQAGFPNVYCPAARIVCSTNILWFVVPAVWSLQLQEQPSLLRAVWGADVFLLAAALNYWMDGTRYTWKMWTDVVAVVTLMSLGMIHACMLGGVTPYVAAIPGAVFAISFVTNCAQLNTCGGANSVNTVWMMTFLSYRWGGLVAAVVVMGGTRDATLMSVWLWCWPRVLILSMAYYLHNLKVWYQTLPLNASCKDTAAFTAAAARYLVEVSVACAFCAAVPSRSSWDSLLGRCTEL